MQKSYPSTERIMQYLKPYCLPVDEICVKDRVNSITSRVIKGLDKVSAIKLAVSMIDLTTLEGKDSRGKVQTMCRKAIHPLEKDSSIPHVAAICVYPNMIQYAKEVVEGSGVKIASVAASFPSGQFPLESKLEEVRKAVEYGADEVDVVINRGEFLQGNLSSVYKEIFDIKKACSDVLLKVILETGELETLDNVKKASFIAMLAGADFIKTSTGKIQPAATLHVTLVMMEAIRDYFLETGKKIGMKPAGGIRTTKDVLPYLVLVKETLGDEWLTPELFRIGASGLLNDLLMQYEKQITGIDQSPSYFLND
jgi:deoxyribose-phosphate aldolase